MTSCVGIETGESGAEITLPGCRRVISNIAKVGTTIRLVARRQISFTNQMNGFVGAIGEQQFVRQDAEVRRDYGLPLSRSSRRASAVQLAQAPSTRGGSRRAR